MKGWKEALYFSPLPPIKCAIDTNPAFEFQPGNWKGLYSAPSSDELFSIASLHFFLYFSHLWAGER